MRNESCFCSWSGGKDSCLALYKAISMGYKPKFLLTTCLESGLRSRSHGLAIEVLQAQAKSIGLPLVYCNTSWSDYRINFINSFLNAKKSISVVTTGVFGDIDIEEHRKWTHEVCTEIGCEALLPLWQCDRKKLLKEFFDLGFKAKIVAVNARQLDVSYLGRVIDEAVISELESLGVDSCGENGEFHTVVTDAPLFSRQIEIIKKGNPQLRNGYWYQDFKL